MARTPTATALALLLAARSVASRLDVLVDPVATWQRRRQATWAFPSAQEQDAMFLAAHGG